MKRTAKSPLADVAMKVGDALRRGGIRGVITGGACASLYARAAHPSIDVDIVLAGAPKAEALDRALAPLGFKRRGDRYRHATVPFYVEFPRGPLGIGEDFGIRPVWKRWRGARALVLSTTDACRDRLAAFYHWNDRQSLADAVAIAMANRVSFRKIQNWSRDEGHRDRFLEFLAEMARARAARKGRARKSRSTASKPRRALKT